MSLIRKRQRAGVEPWSVLSELQRDLNTWFNDSLDQLAESRFPVMGLLDREGWPPVDVVETPDAFLVKAELPGQERDRIAIQVQGRTLSLEGECGAATSDVAGEVLRAERAVGKFRRTIGFPVNVEAAQVTATYRNGILEIRLPKVEEQKPRQVEVKIS
jgi:HSP20 family protein